MMDEHGTMAVCRHTAPRVWVRSVREIDGALLYVTEGGFVLGRRNGFSQRGWHVKPRVTRWECFLDIEEYCQAEFTTLHEAKAYVAAET
jgi:hypothetical protein